MSVTPNVSSQQVAVFSPNIDGVSAQLPLQQQVLTQRIWGAFDPDTNRIIGVQISGESIYQNVPNALITPAHPGVRTASGLATQTVITLGKDVQGDGGGGFFSAVPGTAMGNVIVGSIAGTTLSVARILDGPPIILGLTVSSALTGQPLGTITAIAINRKTARETMRMPE